LSELTPKQLLGVVSKQYEIVQNDSLLRMAEFIREEVDMDCVIVLSDGAKVCFTATLRGAETDIVPGDTVKRRIVGYLGHDGKTGCGAKFTNIRVVCQNTLTAALGESGAHSSITHKNGANNNFDALIESIDVARQDFVTECELMREFSRRSMGIQASLTHLSMRSITLTRNKYSANARLCLVHSTMVMALSLLLCLSGLVLTPSHR
jgi:hypothetical protein